MGENLQQAENKVYCRKATIIHAEDVNIFIINSKDVEVVLQLSHGIPESTTEHNWVRSL